MLMLVTLGKPNHSGKVRIGDEWSLNNNNNNNKKCFQRAEMKSGLGIDFGTKPRQICRYKCVLCQW